MLDSRIRLSLPLLSFDGVNFISHDDNEYDNLKKLQANIGYKFKANLIWNNSGHTDNQFEIKINHEFISVSYKDNPSFGYVIDPNTRKESNLWKNIAENSITKNGVANPYSEITLPIGFPCVIENGEIQQNIPKNDFFNAIDGLNFFPREQIKKFNISFPIRKSNANIINNKLNNEVVCLSGWANANKLKKFIANNCQSFFDEDGMLSFYLSKNGTIYYRKEKENNRNINSVLQNFSTTEKAKYELENMGLSIDIYPKPKELIEYVLKIGTVNKTNLILDYFAGSGTTAHAVINLNREDGGKRKYILVEQGEYFDTVLKPRVQKVVYSKDWKDGKPVADKESGSLNGVSQMVKVLKLESYEDTLNNLVLQNKGDLFGRLPESAQQDYLLHYMLDLESRDSLLNTDVFKKPFDYRLNIAADSAGAYTETAVDLVETFNYLLGLRVQAVDDKRFTDGYVFVEGYLKSPNETILLVWRDCERWDYDKLPELLKKRRINPQDSEYEAVYINGDHTLPTAWQSDDGMDNRSLKILQIEAEFLRLMFAEA